MQILNIPSTVNITTICTVVFLDTRWKISNRILNLPEEGKGKSDWEP